MANADLRIHSVVVAIILLLNTATLWAGPAYQPPGANLTYGDVTHGQRVLSASTNPAAAAADQARAGEKPTRGAVLSTSAGFEYGNLDNLFEFYDDLTKGYDPGDSGGDSGPGQNPGDKPDGGIDLGEIWDQLNPDIQAAVEAVAVEVAKQTVLLVIIREEGYGRAWVSADFPIVLNKSYAGGAWTLGLNWSGSAKTFGLVENIDFDRAAAEGALTDWFTQNPVNRPSFLPLSSELTLYYDAPTNTAKLGIDNDSSILSKATQTTELSGGYSRLAWSGDSGSLFVGTKARLYLMRLSRFSFRFGDITDSGELFDSIRDNRFTDDTRLGLDVGVLWVADRYQLGAQLTNLNQPKFSFPDLDLQLYRSLEIIELLQRDQVYEMDSQLRLEASIFGDERRWSAHIGLDADRATDPLGDDYQWLTLSAGFITSRSWLPNVRFGYRENLSGSRVKYLGAGLTMFEIINFDVATALESVRINDNKLPQGLMVSIGFQINW